MPNAQNLNNDVYQEYLRRGFLSQAELLRKNMESITEDGRDGLAKHFMGVGLVLIPSDHLLDNQVVVSREVYNAAKRI